MKLLFLLTSIILLIGNLSAQQFYLETFDSSPCAAGSGCNPSLVSWTVTATGAQGANANQWYVSDQESGLAPPACGAAGAGDQSLHVGNVPTSTAAFIFCPGGDCGSAYDDSSPAEISNTRAESPIIDCSGQANITVEFNYLEAGEGGDDDCSFWYNDGSTWIALDPIAKSNVCGSGQGQWTAVSTISLPASANNNPNVRIGFLWVNDGDGAATDPSFAVDDIQLINNTALNADFSASLTALCEGDCIDFTDLSTSTAVGGITDWAWTFTGASTGSSTAQNPTGICYPNAGNYDVSLMVTDADGNDTETKIAFMVVNAPVDAGADNSSTICNNTTLDLNTLLTSGVSGGTWLETTGTPSGQFTAATGALDGNGLAAGSYTFTYTITGTSPCADAVANINITVNNCNNPNADFSASQIVLCEGDCIDFTDLSTSSGVISNWDWSFSGANTLTSNSQNPTNICYLNAGSFDVVLTVTDGNGSDTETKVTHITVNAPVSAGADNAAVLCNSSTLDLNTLLSSGVSGGVWSETSANISGQFSTGTGVLDGNTLVDGVIYTFSYTVNGTAPCADAVANFIITISDCSGPTAAFTINVQPSCETASLELINNSIGATSYEWIFEDGTSVSSVNATTDVDYSTTATVTLVAVDASGNSDTIIQNQNVLSFDDYFSITVPNVFTPNNDGINDHYEIIVPGKINECVEFEVYNRWGQIMFQASGNNIKWDGYTEAGKRAPSGTYFYIVKINEVTRKGTIHLLDSNK